MMWILRTLGGYSVTTCLDDDSPDSKPDINFILVKTKDCKTPFVTADRDMITSILNGTYEGNGTINRPYLERAFVKVEDIVPVKLGR